MRIATLENGQLTSQYEVQDGGLINATLKINGGWVSNPSVEDMKSIGYKKVNEGVMPEYQVGFYIQESYVYGGEEIMVNYVQMVVVPFNPGGIGL